MTRSRLGTVREVRPGRWMARVTVGYKADGTRRTASKTLNSEADAWSWVHAKSVEMGARPDLSAGITLDDLWESYKAGKGGRLATRTIMDYTRYMGLTWLPIFGQVDVSAIAVPDIQRVILACSTRSVAKHARRALSSVLSYGVSLGALAHNPLHGVTLELPGDTGNEWEDEEEWDSDPFAVIERSRDVWGATTVMECFERIRGLPLEPVWLVMVGAGLRMEEAFALRGMDVRRIEIGGRMVTQVAVHHARTDVDARKRTKTRRSVRIVAVMEPFGERYWELASAVKPGDLVCKADPSNQNRRWKSYFDKPKTHARMAESRMVSGKLRGLPYVPLSRMRATHATLMQEAGVLDSVNAAVHGHTERVSREHYMRAGSLDATAKTEGYLRLVGDS